MHSVCMIVTCTKTLSYMYQTTIIYLTIFINKFQMQKNFKFNIFFFLFPIDQLYSTINEKLITLEMFRVPLKNSNRLIRLTNNRLSHAASAPAVSGHNQVAQPAIFHPRIGQREIVGFGHNGTPAYFDHAFLPLPSVRWQENTAEIARLREKARSDWSTLTADEKKTC